MKVLIQDYRDNNSSRFQYLPGMLSMIDGVEIYKWERKNLSKVYDTFDSIKPDLVIMHYQSLNQDIVKYLKSSTNIRIVFDVTDITETNIKELEEIVSSNNINCPLVITERGPQSTVLKTLVVPPCADIVTPSPLAPTYEIETLFVSETEDYDKSLLTAYESYHTCLVPTETVIPLEQPDFVPNNGFDFLLNVSHLNPLYKNYKQVVIHGSLEYCTSQIFFEALIRANKVILKYPESERDNFLTFLGKTFSESDKDPTEEQIKEQIKAKHTCVSRSLELLVALGMQQEAQILVNKVGAASA